ncbi:AAA family ATPase [Collinsella provencensis]|uniref:AAA family ATPase n=1 Tax=Collinsella provencensis TaxID=1937461 RepID=UPI001F264243|nr:P-loop NTPase [Collinsella provencensis]
MITVISGRGGVGKTTLVTAMAAYAAHAGLRAAVLDLDLMFGNAWELMGAAGFRGIEGVGLHADERGLAERDIEDAAMRIGPGLTLWGPCERPEQAECCADSIERLVDVLREVADVIFVDTSGQWGDAVAMAVAKCDRCLVLGGPGTSLASSGKRAVSLATRLGVSHTRMTCVVNRFGAHDCNEERALSFEMATALHSRVRIADGGDEVQNMLAFGKVNSLMEGPSAFAKDVRLLTASLLQELGCPNAQWLLEEEHKRAGGDNRLRLRLPWKRRASDAL